MEFMGRKIVTTCDGAVPTTASGKSCSNGNYRRRQTHGIGSLQEKVVTGKVMSLGDKQRVIRKSMGIDSMVKNRGGEYPVLKPPIAH